MKKRLLFLLLIGAFLITTLTNCSMSDSENESEETGYYKIVINTDKVDSYSGISGFFKATAQTYNGLSKVVATIRYASNEDPGELVDIPEVI